MTNRSLTYNCYDFYGSVNETRTVTMCLQRVINQIQQGKDMEQPFFSPHQTPQHSGSHELEFG